MFIITTVHSKYNKKYQFAISSCITNGFVQLNIAVPEASNIFKMAVPTLKIKK